MTEIKNLSLIIPSTFAPSSSLTTAGPEFEKKGNFYAEVADYGMTQNKIGIFLLPTWQFLISSLFICARSTAAVQLIVLHDGLKRVKQSNQHCIGNSLTPRNIRLLTGHLNIWTLIWCIWQLLWKKLAQMECRVLLNDADSADTKKSSHYWKFEAKSSFLTDSRFTCLVGRDQAPRVRLDRKWK